MRHKHIMIPIILGVLLFLTGCVAVKPAKIENGLYTNPGYQFSLRVPLGWETSEELPEPLKRSIPYLSRQKFKATFSDLNNKCFILLSAEKTEADWVSFKMYTDKFIKSLDKYYAKEKKKFLGQPKSNYYNYTIYENQIAKCDGNCLGTKVDFGAEDLKCSGHNIIYKSRNSKVYSIALILIAREQQYNNSLEIFKKVVASFNYYQ